MKKNKKNFIMLTTLLLFLATFLIGSLKITSATTTIKNPYEKLVGYYTGTYKTTGGNTYNIILDINKDSSTGKYLAYFITLKAPYDSKNTPAAFLLKNAIGYYELNVSYSTSTKQYTLQGNRIDKKSPSKTVKLSGILSETGSKDFPQFYLNGLLNADNKFAGNFKLTKNQVFTMIAYEYNGDYYGYTDIIRMEFQRIKKLNR